MAALVNRHTKGQDRQESGLQHVWSMTWRQRSVKSDSTLYHLDWIIDQYTWRVNRIDHWITRAAVHNLRHAFGNSEYPLTAYSSHH